MNCPYPTLSAPPEGVSEGTRLSRPAVQCSMINCLSPGTTGVPLRTISRRDPLVGSAAQRSMINCLSPGTTSVPLRGSSDAVEGDPPRVRQTAAFSAHRM
ncbi:MAG: hypothetical protein KatS3mg112_1362 [Thermogutta sp.]|nr:MAG: hypothetical protein KatS3mg112_1362 [Thermogutta sp.]